MDVFCSRTLIRRTPNGAAADVTIEIGRPERSIEPDGDYACSVRITGFGEPILSRALGTDGLQSVENAFQIIAATLAPHRDELFYLDDIPYEELAVVAVLFDAGRRRRLRDLLDEDAYALEIGLREWERNTALRRRQRRDSG